MNRVSRHPCRRSHHTAQGFAACAFRTRLIIGTGPFAAVDTQARRNPVVILCETASKAQETAESHDYTPYALLYDACECPWHVRERY